MMMLQMMNNEKINILMMFIHVIQGQCFDVLRQPYDIYTKPFQKCCLRTYEGI
jgi:hypothetical protein